MWYLSEIISSIFFVLFIQYLFKLLFVCFVNVWILMPYLENIKFSALIQDDLSEMFQIMIFKRQEVFTENLAVFE